VLSSGCIQLDYTLSLEKDGSGRVDLVYTVPEYLVAQIKAMHDLENELASLAGEADAPPWEDQFIGFFFEPSEEALRQKLKTYERAGVSVKKLKVSRGAGLVNVRLKAAFRSLGDLASTDFFSQYGFSLCRNRAGNYEFERTSRHAGTRSPPRVLDAGSRKALASMLAGFRVVLSLEVPGRILEANTSKREMNRATWVYDAGAEEDPLLSLQYHRMTAVFEGTGVRLPETEQTSGSAETGR
jgi:hypothetical protein